jgi:hypothetical protein
MSSTPHYLVKPDDLVALRVAMSMLLDKCNEAILNGKTLPVSEEYYENLKATENNTRYINLYIISK